MPSSLRIPGLKIQPHFFHLFQNDSSSRFKFRDIAMTLPNFLLKSVSSKPANMNKRHPTVSFLGSGRVLIVWPQMGRSSSPAGPGEAEPLAPPAPLWPLLGLGGGSRFNGPVWSRRRPPPAGFSAVSQEQWATSHSHNSSPHSTLSTGSSGDSRYRRCWEFCAFYPSLPSLISPWQHRPGRLSQVLSPVLTKSTPICHDNGVMYKELWICAVYTVWWKVCKIFKMLFLWPQLLSDWSTFACFPYRFSVQNDAGVKVCSICWHSESLWLTNIYIYIYITYIFAWCQRVGLSLHIVFSHQFCFGQFPWSQRQ